MKRPSRKGFVERRKPNGPQAVETAKATLRRLLEKEAARDAEREAKP